MSSNDILVDGCGSYPSTVFMRLNMPLRSVVPMDCHFCRMPRKFKIKLFTCLPKRSDWSAVHSYPILERYSTNQSSSASNGLPISFSCLSFSISSKSSNWSVAIILRVLMRLLAFAAPREPASPPTVSTIERNLSSSNDI